MKEKELEKKTGLSRRQIIMLQKLVIERKNKVVVGISYDYSEKEVESFMLAKVFKDCGYTYTEIKEILQVFNTNKIEVINKAKEKVKEKINELENVLNDLNNMKGKGN